MAQQPIMSKATLEGIIASVEADPLAGQGTLSKRDLLIDRLLAHWNVCGGGSAKSPAPLLSEPVAKVAS